MALITSCATQRGFPPEHQIVNFDAVDGIVYRGAQPTYFAIGYLAKIGVRSVVNLRELNDAKAMPDEELFVRKAGMEYLQYPLSGLTTPTAAQINDLLSKMDSLPKPVFVHCQFGCDRTGIVVACWRIRTDQWDSETALREAKAHGISPLLPNFAHFIKSFR